MREDPIFEFWRVDGIIIFHLINKITNIVQTWSYPSEYGFLKTSTFSIGILMVLLCKYLMNREAP